MGGYEALARIEVVHWLRATTQEERERALIRYADAYWRIPWWRRLWMRAEYRWRYGLGGLETWMVAAMDEINNTEQAA